MRNRSACNETGIVQLLIAALLITSLAMVACGTDDGAGSAPTEDLSTPAPGEMVTVNRVLALARHAARTAVSYQAKGGAVYSIPGEEDRSSSTTIEWTAPDRKRQFSRTNFRVESGFTIGETIRVGDRVFVWTEVIERRRTIIPEYTERNPSDSEANTALLYLDLVDATRVGPQSLDGVSVYRLVGAPAQDATPFADGSGQSTMETTDILFIDATDFRLLRLERTAIHADASAVVDSGVTSGFTEVFTLDFEYFDEPIEIEQPDTYTGLNGELVEPTVTPTPLGYVAPERPTPTPFPTAPR